MIGWTVSAIESICLTILVGLSVDYTIHLANSWRESVGLKDREKRLQATLLEIGISVFSASITTFLACIPLFFCYILFFQKFGIFIALTIFWSTIYVRDFLARLLPPLTAWSWTCAGRFRRMGTAAFSLAVCLSVGCSNDQAGC